MKNTVQQCILKLNRKKYKMWGLLHLSWATIPGMDR